MQNSDCGWTVHDTQVCAQAELSGMTIVQKTSEPLTFDQLDQLALEYDKVRDSITSDEFFNSRLTSKPFEF